MYLNLNVISKSQVSFFLFSFFQVLDLLKKLYEKEYGKIAAEKPAPQPSKAAEPEKKRTVTNSFDDDWDDAPKSKPKAEPAKPAETKTNKYLDPSVEEPKKSKAQAAIEQSKKSSSNKYFDKENDLLDNIPTI